jgi:hypothetical protein
VPSFFDPPPPSTPPPIPPALRLPPWAGPPARVLGELVRDRVLIYRGSGLAVTLEHLRAYPEGFEFRVCVRSRHALSGFGFPHGIGIRGVGPMSVPGHQILPADQQLRLGLGFADGTRVTNLSPLIGVGLDETPPKALLVQQGVSGIGGRWDQRYWVWGLPPEGPLAAVVAWRAMAFLRRRWTSTPARSAPRPRLRSRSGRRSRIRRPRLSPSRASFSVWLGASSPYLPTHRGGAVVVDGRWKVSRATFCALLARVGVACPPVN